MDINNSTSKLKLNKRNFITKENELNSDKQKIRDAISDLTKKEEKDSQSSKHMIKKNKLSSQTSKEKATHKNRDEDNGKEMFNYEHVLVNDKKEEESDHDVESNPSSESKPVVDAFRFMMDSRNKVIGRNSPGKELNSIEEDLASLKGSKQKLHARKALLEKWAHTKGYNKRKAEEKERDEYISYALDKRAKRMKKLLLSSTEAKHSQNIKIDQTRIEKDQVTKIVFEKSNNPERSQNDNLSFSNIFKTNNTDQLSRDVFNSEKNLILDGKAINVEVQKNKENVKRRRRQEKIINNKKSTITKETSLKQSNEDDGTRIPDEKPVDINDSDDSTDEDFLFRSRKASVKQLCDSSNSMDKVSYENRDSVKPLTDTSIQRKGLLGFLGILKDGTGKLQETASDTEVTNKRKKRRVDKRRSEPEKDSTLASLKGRKENTSNQDKDVSNREKSIDLILNEKFICADVPKNEESIKRSCKQKKIIGQRKSTVAKKASLKQSSRADSTKMSNEKPVDINNSDESTDEDFLFRSRNASVKQLCDSSNSLDKLSNENRDLIKPSTDTLAQQKGLLGFLGILKNDTHNLQETASDTELIANDRKKRRLDTRRSELLKGRERDYTPSTLAALKKKQENTSNREEDVSQEICNMKLDSKKDKSERQHKRIRKHSLKMRTTWKMKLRLNIADDDDEVSQSNDCFRNNEIILNNKFDDNNSRAESIVVSSESEAEKDVEDKPTPSTPQPEKVVKLAPLFLKNSKKKRNTVDSAARKDFLNSGLPESLVKSIQKQKSLVEEVECERFPSVSHVVVKPSEKELEKHSLNFWNLPQATLKLTTYKDEVPINCRINDLALITKSKVPNSVTCSNLSFSQISCFKKLVKNLKLENPDYPIYRAFRTLKQKQNGTVLHESNELVVSKEASNKKRKHSKNKKSNDVPSRIESVFSNIQKPLMWTEKYKPSSSEDIFGNLQSVTELKNWLETWVEFHKEINAQNKGRKRSDSSSSSDFEICNSNSGDNPLPGNTIIIIGPHGSGKTTAVYALCNELDINILELNASSKRTGKRLLQELQEATQSHQVRSHSNTINSFFQNDNKQTTHENSNERSSSKFKLSLLLVEDVDIIFDQDEGFLGALSQILITSKRPVILTTADSTCQHLQKFVSQHPVIAFSSLTPKVLGGWLQVLCLIEGSLVDKKSLCELLEWNKGDVRKTLMQLQFWVQSGGNIKEVYKLKDQKTDKIEEANTEESNSLALNENSNDLCLENDKEEEEDVNIHSNCMQSFIVDRCQFNNNILWWNLYNLIGNGAENEDNEVCKDNCNKNDSLKKIKAAMEFSDSLSLLNCLQRHTDVEDVEIAPRLWERGVKDSLQLDDRLESYDEAKDLVEDLSCCLLQTCIENLAVNSMDENRINLTVPTSEKICLRIKGHTSDQTFLQVVPQSCLTDRRAIFLDYIPTVRNIARTEAVRWNSNAKRKNRFYHYLRGFGLSGTETCFNTACNIFTSTS